MPSGYEYSIDGGSAVDVGNVLTTPVTGLTPFQQYGFRVRAYDASGNRSAWSATVNATPVPYVLYGGNVVTYNGDPVYYS